MTTYTVGTSPQAIYPDGHNDAFAITNNGPWTVLIDDNSSIGDGSYEIPPLASIPWNKHRPLWIMAKPAPSLNLNPISFPVNLEPGYLPSTIRITRQTDVLSFTQGNVDVLLAKGTVKDTYARFPPIESVAFGSLIINVASALTANFAALDTTHYNMLCVFWYAPDGSALTQEKYRFPELDQFSSTSLYPSQFIIPIKGAYAEIYLTQPTAGLPFYDVSVYGSVTRLDESVRYWAYDVTETTQPARADRTFVRFPDFGGSDIALWDSFYAAAGPNVVYLSPITKTVTIAVRSVGIVGAATMVIEMTPWPDLPSAGNFLDELAIPAGSSVVSTTIKLPFASPVRLRTAYAGAGSMRLSLIWS